MFYQRMSIEVLDYLIRERYEKSNWPTPYTVKLTGPYGGCIIKCARSYSKQIFETSDWTDVMQPSIIIFNSVDTAKLCHN